MKLSLVASKKQQLSLVGYVEKYLVAALRN
jgi:hypothetical protein